MLYKHLVYDNNKNRLSTPLTLTLFSMNKFQVDRSFTVSVPSLCSKTPMVWFYEMSLKSYSRRPRHQPPNPSTKSDRPCSCRYQLWRDPSVFLPSALIETRSVDKVTSVDHKNVKEYNVTENYWLYLMEKCFITIGFHYPFHKIIYCFPSTKLQLS